MGEIVDTGALSETEYVREHMVATTEPTDSKIEFHVSMRSWTQSDMEELIVEAAARMIVGRSVDNRLAKAIEAKCVELTAKKADAALAKVAAEIVDQPMIPSFGAKEPVTMREYLGLYGREYLTQKVDISEKPTTSSYDGKPRIVRIVERAMDAKFKSEIERATNAAVQEIQNQIRARHAEIIASEKARLRAAMDAVVATTPAN